jgi:23S rRNA C2498 (ribose-2'-O)-methylase RlmM
MGYDLVLQRAGTPRDRSRAERTLAALMAELPDAGAWQPLLAFSEPGEEDQALVEEVMDEEDSGEAERFEAFCRRHAVSVRTAMSNAGLCAAFVDEEWGSDLVCVTLPPIQPSVAWAHLVSFAARHGLVIHDMQTGAAVDLTDPGTLPRAY